MSADPVLVLQLQRMGDIILSYPLLLWLSRQWPERRAFVVAEPTFYNELLGVSPAATYLPWTATGQLAARRWSLVANLSHRPEGAALCAALETGRRLGATLSGGALRVQGDWQLYRASLSHNNRHNRFHWAELNALDCVDPALMAATSFDTPRRLGPEKAVGLFLGASEPDKRPDAPFWAALARECERRGLKPVLLGGPADQPLCAEVKALHGGRLADFCGRFGLREFAAMGQTLGLMITPDTGPMHLAAWTGLATLNLSMGPVNPWETGPYNPGHHVLRADMACLDCWRCRFGRPHCKDRFDPAQVAYLARRIVEGARLKNPPGMRLYETARSTRGLYHLRGVPPAAPRASDVLGELWRASFGAFFGLWDDQPPREAWQALAREHPRLAKPFARGLDALSLSLARSRAPGRAREQWRWREAMPMLRPLAGYVHMRLDNEDHSPQALAACMEMADRLRDAAARV
ncbi:hypothetical protein NNJEOMEG_00885 [Fundidesulfovibrio magnetotacticus]|uniref:ADP-heptose:LPS heptosyltransferase n=1 Tax=Fundidesulfovibrio magnetotacticus TaxID=2730080 RepID=A0A6V8LTB7_9BACT|nr:glycosyltransferase family 9 protein [Fundidesulfovibrio magnetotacticus]GFK93056.1 hypothetical protein NNJEOMEG_00885 [Fundidesulfovibrio magnetotacticus]